MKKRGKSRKFTKTDAVIAAVLVALIAALAAGIRLSGKKGTGGSAAQPEEVTYKAYNGRKIGILTGTNMEAASFEYFPDSEYFYFDGYPNLNAALENGVIDAYLGDEPALKSIHAA